MKFHPIIIAVLLLIFLYSPAQAQKEADPYKGKHLYYSYCMPCHGADGNSGGPLAKKLHLKPAKLANDKYQKKNIDEMTSLISGYNRGADSSMPAWRDALPEKNIRHIAAYLSRLKNTSLRFTGNTRRGKMIFRSACSSCHGPKGQGNGVLAKLIGAPMVNFTKAGAIKHLGDKSLVMIIKKGKGKFMPGWEGTLNNDEITDVASYVRSIGR